MLLTLRYQPTAQRPACAALLRGADPAAWLREIGRWGLAARQLSCYLVPESIRSVRTAGLLVVVKDGSPLPADVLEPYGWGAPRLLVPVQARLWPATTPEELGAALLWPCQLLHPSIGLVGFEAADELDLGALLDCSPPRPTNWGRALPGPAPKPRLQQVRILTPLVAEVVDSLREGVGTVPLTQLPGVAEDRPGPVQEALDNLRRRLLKVALAVARWWPALPVGPVLRTFGAALLLVLGACGLLYLISQVGSGSGSIMPVVTVIIMVLARLIRGASEGSSASRPASRRPATPARPGLFQRLERWLGGRIDNLEKKRQGEIERLLQLFKDNPGEALKYAIPLGGPYLNRGAAAQSARLGPRATDFNLGGLGGGGRVDVWDLDAYRQSLSQQYQAAAAHEMKAGRHKKAAYIYAHLLGDYHAAANALESGGFYREAAALYKDHLRNLPAAAKCLENGGLLTEAADLYVELKEHEKAGDLYQRLEQPAQAARHYERGVALFLDNQDHPAAARLLAHKLADAGRAQAVLLEGWSVSKQPEVCLKQYFDVLAAEPEEDLSAHVRNIFQHHTPAGRRVPLLNVLAAVNNQHATPELRGTSLEVAYEVVSSEAQAGNAAPLALLKNFLPDDRLVAADCSRYATRRPRAQLAARPSAGPTAPPLDPSVRWKAARAYRQQWVAVGLRAGRLHLARGNWYGNVEYYSWLAPVAAETEIVLVADEQLGPRIMLQASEVLALETKTLPKNKYFAEALTVGCPSWLPPWPARVCLLPDGATASARLQDEVIVVSRFSAEGQMLAPLRYRFAEGNPDEYATGRNWPAELLYRDGMYYSYWHDWLVCWSEDGRGRRHKLPARKAMQLVASPYAPKLQLVVATPENLFIWEPTRPISNEPLPAFTSAFELTGDLQFVGPEHMVMLDDSSATLLRAEANGYEQVRLIEVERPIAVLATSNRQQFALLEANGRLTLHSIPEA